MTTNQDSGKQDPHPYAKVTSIRPVVRDGWYNGFTDLAYWKDYFWLSYARLLGHHGERTVRPTSGNSLSVILRSADLRRWHRAQTFEPPGGIVDGSGVGQCHFTSDGDRLYGYFPVQTPGTSHAMWRSSTADGVRWSEPEVLKLDDGRHPYAWRVRWHEGKFYSMVNCYGEAGAPRLDLIESDDGVNWRRRAAIATGLPPGGVGEHAGYTEEADLHWRPDGSMWCVCRTQPQSLFFRAAPPYENWAIDLLLPDGCDAPVMCTCGDDVYLAGRCAIAASRGLHNTFSHHSSPFSKLGTTGLYRLRPGQADLLVTLPPGADAAYAGLVSLESGKLIMSTYSDVAYISGQVRPMNFPEYEYKRSECDIYIAEIEVGQV